MKQTVFTFILLSLSSLLWANEITQSLQQNKQQITELQRKNQQHWLAQHQYQATHSSKENADLAQICLDYQGIRFIGITLIDPSSFMPQEGECLNEIRLNQLSQQITQAYLDKGYIHNPLQFEDDQSGWLIAHVFEGKIADIENDNKHLNVAQILPNSVGKPLKIQDLDQALDQANRVAGNNVTVDVLPAKNGEIKLVFNNDVRKRINGTVGVDSYASKSYERWQNKIAVNIGNPLNWSDSLYLSGTHTLKSPHQFSRSALFYYTIPYGYWSFSYLVSASQFKSLLSLPSTTLRQTGRTLQTSLTADYVVHRGTNHISTFSAQFEQIDSKNRLGDVILELQSPKITSISIGVNHLQLFEKSTLVADMRYEQGKNKGKNQPRDYFNRWNLGLNLNHYQSIGSQLFRYSHQLTGQYSDHYLPSVKQEDFTGRYRIRGLNDLSLSAEKNAVLQNNIAWIKQTDFGVFSPYLGFDFGWQKAVSSENNSDKALSYVIGLNWEYQAIQANLEWATGRLFEKAHGVKQQNLLLGNFVVKF